MSTECWLFVFSFLPIFIRFCKLLLDKEIFNNDEYQSCFYFCPVTLLISLYNSCQPRNKVLYSPPFNSIADNKIVCNFLYRWYRENMAETSRDTAFFFAFFFVVESEQISHIAKKALKFQQNIPTIVTTWYVFSVCDKITQNNNRSKNVLLPFILIPGIYSGKFWTLLMRRY